VRFEFKFGIVSFYFSFIFVSLENHVCLSRGVQVAGAAWCAAMTTVAGVGDMVQRIGDGRTGQVLGGQAVKLLVPVRAGSQCCGGEYITSQDPNL
jgi:hypothetical protein